MKIGEAIRISLASLWSNKLRSVLTLLGVVIAVASLIAVVTFVNGINGYVAEKIFNLGADVFIINKTTNAITNVDEYIDGLKRKDIRIDDYEAVVEGCVACKYVGASAPTTTGNVKYAEVNSTDTNIRGWTASMNPIYDLDMTLGRSVNEADVNNASPVAVIGADVQENLMTGVDPIDKEIRVDGRLYRVIGVGKPRGKTLGQSQDNWVILPISTWFKAYGTQGQSLRIWVKAYGVGTPLTTAMDETRVIMRSRRHDRAGQPDSFALDTNQSFLSIWSAISSSFFLVMILIASIALIVGGIVIMNIMLVAVTERTREIGIRKAMGARRADILRQFLIEATALALLGGVLGVTGGIGIAKGVTALIGMPSAIRIWTVFAGLGLAASVGIFFGVYPASKASKLDPIAALRFEL
ncbi:MAG TPA: ABC transporter permease [Candidatus Koribacter sp.]|jgi:putative ABC transport system permease protein